MTNQPARRAFRALTRTRGGYDGGVMYDVQLQVASTGRLVWAQTFTDREEADTYERGLDQDLNDLDAASFAKKYRVPASG